MFDQIQKAEHFRSLHNAPQILVLPNAWDATSACIFQQAGFPAVATTSAGIAAMLGYPDGQVIPRDQMLLVIERIASSVSLPVSADIEAGYGKTVPEVLETVRRAIRAGVVGINLEDSTHLADPPVMDLDYQCDLIRAVRQEAEAAGVPIVINARVDIFLREVGAVSGRYDRTLERARAYLEAGADCIFPFGLSDGVKIARLVQQTPGPLNILAGPGAPTLYELELMGVRRVTFGSSLMRATLPIVKQLAERLRRGEDVFDLVDHPFTHAVVNRMFGEA
ncbi:MAG: isocitrate lyase/phosphoenolpyruvate mutase family protein [Anaerolineales bacterium]|nr:isocitrate lyase/phosphoenolpyruvate mutase family protein [Anaerolineales bacterium]